MTLPEIKNHWENWASEFGTDLRATTKTPTIKQIEVDVLYRTIKGLFSEDAPLRLLDIGCGNGYNCFALTTFFPNYTYVGVDYSPTMIDNAKKIKQEGGTKYDKVSFAVGDVLNLVQNTEVGDNYDVAYSDRCIINLNTLEMQTKSFDEIMSKVKTGGYYLMLENSVQTHSRQNDLREAVNLPRRQVMEFNLFIDEPAFLAHTEKTAELVSIRDFGTLHDLVLYVLIPMINGGEVDYNHQWTRTVTDFLVSLPEEYSNQFGSFGQNRLWIFKKK